MENYAQKILKLLNIEDKVKFGETDNNTAFEIICNEVEILKSNDLEYRHSIKQLTLEEYPKYNLEYHLDYFPNLEVIYDYKGIILWKKCD